MTTYKLAEPAQADIESIIKHTLDTWSQAQTLSYIEGLEKLMRSLAQAPKLGNIYLSDGLRVFSYLSHVLSFIKETHGITIIRVLHENMNPALHVGKEDSL